jgi:hypothetical protein
MLGGVGQSGLRRLRHLSPNDPDAWNSHYGLERATKFVERPLTGPGGQLDANGNFRAP